MIKEKGMDDLFLSILDDWVNLTTTAAESAVASILRNSSEYLSADQQKALSDFYDLYFTQGDLEVNKDAINREVDSLFDAIQADLAASKDGSKLTNVSEDEEAKRARLSLSGVQKQLETIIQLESGLKEKLVPVLTSMQFEDALKQRLTRMAQAWRMSLEYQPASAAAAKELGKSIAKTLGSKIERDAFYPLVLKEESPQEAIEEIAIFDSLI